MAQTASVSYVSGVSDIPLLGQTIGESLLASAALFGPREAVVECTTGRRYSYAELVTWSRQVARGLMAKGVRKGDRVGIWSPNCPEWVAVQYGTALIGAILVNVNPAYRAPSSSTCCARPVSALSSAPPGTRPATTAPWSRRSARSCRGLRRRDLHRRRPLGRLSRRLAPGRRSRSGGRPARLGLRRSHQHPVHLGDDRLPQGGHPFPSQHPQQRLLRGAACSATPKPTGSACRCPSTTASGW